MADREHVIRIKITADDQTRAAYLSAAANQELLNAATKEGERQAKAHADAIENSQRKLSASNAELERRLADLNLENKNAIESAVRLETATTNLRKTQDDSNASLSKKALALKQVATAEDELTEAIKGEDEALGAVARRQAQGIKNAQQRRDIAQRSLEDVRRAAAEEEKLQKEREASARRTAAEEARIAAQRERSARERNSILIGLERELARSRDREVSNNERRIREEERQNDRRVASNRRVAAEQTRARQQIERESDALGRKLSAADLGRDNIKQVVAEFNKLQSAYRQAGGDVDALSNRQTAFIRKARTDFQALSRDASDYLTRVKQIRDLEAERAQALKRGDQVTVTRIDLDASRAEAEAATIAAGLREIFHHIEANIDLDAGALEAKVPGILAVKELLGKDVHFNVDVDRSSLSRLRQFDGFMRGFLGSMKEGFHDTGSQIAVFDNILRGLVALGITGFFQSFVVSAGAAVGVLTALASSAAFAAGAIGGTLTAGIAQAIPMFGLLATAASRVKGVTDAVGQANLLQQQQSYQAGTAAKSQADSLDTLRAAHERVRDAQNQLTEARANARRELESLILAEQRASLSVKEAQEAIQQSVLQGRVGELPGLRLDEQEARLRQRDAARDVRQTRTGQTPEIESAVKSLQDAQRALPRAQRAADQAGSSVTAAQGKLAFLLSQMSDAERRLYRALTNLQNRFRDFAKDVTEPLINSFAGAANRITVLLDDPRIRNSARGLSRDMGAQFTRVFDFLTGDRFINQWLRIIRQSRENLKPIGDIAISLGRAFLNISEAAGPALNRLLKFIRDIVRDFARFTTEARKSGELGAFFQRGVTHLEAWLKLLGAIGRTFGAIFSIGEGTGLRILTRLTRAFNNFADNIKEKGSPANKFFVDFFKVAEDGLAIFGPVLVQIAQGFADVFGDEADSGGGSMRAFASILSEVLIPAFFEFLQVMGGALNLVARFLEAFPQAGQILSAVIAFTLMGTVFGRLFTFLKPVLEGLKFLKVALVGEGSAAQAVRIFALALRGLLFNPFTAIVLAIGFLLVKFHLLDNVIRGIGRAFREAWREIEPEVRPLISSINDLGDALGSRGGLMRVLQPLAKFISNVLINVFITLGQIVGRTLAGIIRVIRGFVDVFVGLLTLNPRRMTRGFREIFEGMFKIATAGLLGIIRFFGRFFSSVGELIGIRGKGLANAFKDVVGGIKNAFNGLGDFVSGIWSGIVAGFVGAINLIIDGINVLIKGFNAIPDILKPGGDIEPLKPIGGAGQDLRAPGGIRRATGGPIGGYGGGDIVPAWLEPGEHVWTKEEVASAGGHGVMVALRRFFGGGLQSSGSRYAEGGGVQQRAKAQGADDVEVTREQTTQILNVLRRFGRVAVEAWRDIWRDINVIERRNLNRIEDDVSSSLRNVARIIKRRGDAIQDAMRDTMRNVMRTSFTGFDYIATTARESLKAFGAKVPDISVERPRGLGRASGGWIGQPGERGQDAIPTWLGRGEAVLNWAQQKVVNSALWNQYGTSLDDLFKSTTAFHAGGPGQMGFAGGGRAGDDDEISGKTHLARLIAAANKVDAAGFNYKWGGGHTQPAQFGPFDCSGVVSYIVQQAGYKVPTTVSGSIGSWGFPGGPDGASIFYNSGHTFARIGSRYFGTSGTWRPNGGAGWFTGTPPASYLGQFQQVHLPGINQVGDFIAGGVEGIKRLLVKGTGPMRSLVQGALDRVRKGANRYISKQDSLLGAGSGEWADVGRPYTGPLDHVFPSHGLADQGGKAQLSPGQVQMLARRAGFNRDNEALHADEIAHGESNRFPGIISFDQGYGLMQNTPRVWGAEALEWLRQIGGTGQLLNPWKNMQIANRLFQSAGRTWSPWFGTRYLTAGQGGYPQGKYDVGGEIPGRTQGQPTPVLAHAGEWIINPRQQQKLAGLLGATTSKIKDFLGFRGGPTSFEGGGEVEHFGLPFRTSQAKSGVFQALDIPIDFFQGLIREAGLAFTALRSSIMTLRRLKKGAEDFGKKTKENTKNFDNAVEALIKPDTGIFAQIAAAIERFATEIANRLVKDQFAGRGRNIRQVLTPDQVADREFDNLVRVGRRTRDLRQEVSGTSRVVEGEFNRVRRQLRNINRGGVTEDEQKERAALVERYQTLFQDRVNLRDLRATLDSQLAENVQARFEAAGEAIRRRFKLDAREADVASVEHEIRRREASGDIAGASAMIGWQVAVLQSQQDAIKKALFTATATGHTELADELAQQLRDIEIALIELATKRVQDQIDAVNASAQRGQGFLDLFDRRSAVRAGFGDTVGAAQDKIGSTQFRGAIIRDQIASLQALIAPAFAAGNAALVQSIFDQITELETALDENTLAQRDAVTAFRQASIDLITGRQSFVGGILGNLGSLLQQFQTATGTDTVQQQLNLLRGGISQLNTTNAALRDKLFEITGIDLRGLSGPSFVSALQNMLRNLDSITAGMTAADKTLFEGLINSIIENESALWSNTAAINELEGQIREPQTWSSTAWQWFREAIFNGMGDVLPQFQVPAMQTGGFVTRTGLFRLHAGEFVVNPDHPGGQGVPGVGDHIDIDIHEAGGPVDVTHLANRIAFEKKVRR